MLAKRSELGAQALDASLVIPTFNRKDSLLLTLESLVAQTIDCSRFEVVVVDDGSTDGTASVAQMSYPFELRYLRQHNAGDASARNLGVQRTEADILVFVDDDMQLAPSYLSAMLATLNAKPNRPRIVVGTEISCSDIRVAVPDESSDTDSISASSEHRFVEVFSRNMCLRREAYLSIGRMDNLGFPGSSMWCDVDFAYRAYMRGFEFRRSTGAICCHSDYVVESLSNLKNRHWEAARRAVVLLSKHPHLLPYLPMFCDKTPIRWQRDGLWLITRKILRRIASSQPILQGLEFSALLAERLPGDPRVLKQIHTWLAGAYLYRGLQEGLRQFGEFDTAF